MNLLTATGRIGQDAELRNLGSTTVAGFSFALTSGFGDKAVTTWLNCSLFGKRAETLTPMLTKGALIAISGQFTNREYPDKSGVMKSRLELNVNDVTLLGGNPNKQSDSHVAKPKADAFDDFESDVPF